jgi:hypothetical protein
MDFMWILYLFFTVAVLALGYYVQSLFKQHDPEQPAPGASKAAADSGANRSRGNSAGSGASGTDAGGAEGENADGEGAGEEGDGFGDSVRLKALKLPGAEGEIARILNARDHYAVLEVARDVSAVDIKKAYRIKQVRPGIQYPLFL